MANKISTLILIMITALGISIVVTSHAACEAERPPIVALHTEGQFFVDSTGRQVILRGINAAMRSKLPPFFPFEPEPDFETALNKYADILDSLGLNVVRLLIMYEAAEPVRGEYDEEYLAHYDRMIDEFAERGFYVIVDSHQDVFSRRFCGDGFPDWMLPKKYRDMPHCSDNEAWELKYLSTPTFISFDRFWLNREGVQDRYVEFFQMLAKRYKDRPEVIGFEPINEPFPGWSGILQYKMWYDKYLYVLYENVGAAVNAVDDRYMVFADICSLENMGVWDTNRRRPDVKNLVFAAHYYDMGYAKFGFFDLGGDTEQMQIGLEKHLKQARAWDVPTLIGEFGVSMHRDDARDYLDRLYSVFDSMQLSGTIWEASMSENVWNNRDKNLMEPDGTLREPAYAIDRPYPRAVAGMIDTFTYDYESKEMRLVWTQNQDAYLPTVIYLPERVYGETPSISVNPLVEYIFDPVERELIVPMYEGATQARITVKP